MAEKRRKERSTCFTVLYAHSRRSNFLPLSEQGGGFDGLVGEAYLRPARDDRLLCWIEGKRGGASGGQQVEISRGALGLHMGRLVVARWRVQVDMEGGSAM